MGEQLGNMELASATADDSTRTDEGSARRVEITVRGVVQGVGFRPFVYNSARSLALAGWVLNEADAVRIQVQGPGVSVQSFLERLQKEHPPQAQLEQLLVHDVPVLEICETAFEIRRSDACASPQPTIPADLATCPDCVAEVHGEGERRFGYPFTNCTNCGPRWSIVEQLPYDRPRTAMRLFEMCDDCRREYDNPADRRFHAQPIACPACGPQLELLDVAGNRLLERTAALDAAAEMVRNGGILALKGLGGFQLLVDATNQEAVCRLRQRKRRPDKPFAVMLRDVAEIRRHCVVDEAEAIELGSPAAPILLLRRHVDSSEDDAFCAGGTPAVRLAGRRCTDLPEDDALAQAVAPDNPTLGVMLPYTPLHHLLLERFGRAVVCTSGNVADEPMATATEHAVQRLGRIADQILTHDRPIVRPVDDSVARVGSDGLQILRRARGYAPLPIRMAHEVPTILAVGGHLKNTVALSLGRHVILSPHIGDLDNILGVQVHEQAIRDLLRFFDVQPDAVACDLHPDYASTRVAERLAAQWQVPLVRTQHHHAHVAACAAEHAWTEPLLGLAWDGTGYGPDRTVWGCESLACDGGRFTRFAHLKTFPLPGGDAAARQPRRAALGVLYQMHGDAAVRWAKTWFTEAELRVLMAALARGSLFPRTSSLGRLFDAVAVLCGLPAKVSFEGQAAMALEFAVDPSETSAYDLPLQAGEPVLMDWAPLMQGVIGDLQSGESANTIAARFHNALAEAAVAVAERAGLKTVALTGGCFQNARLTRQVAKRLGEAGFQVLMHRRVPPGDGGIALGQIVIAAGILKG